ncbi:diaminopimelate epimerase [Roseicyclus sp. F158]|uniref:Diaminopimelate epimerase n=1 Tax=Tropicimonas omnivorans TaxID=3075590 RepID=A0ABU3DC27_9RHOB|nr:diaminopimelate epimerase [Roseicyclus sp. F158]MDT0681266.1 diaminopimelate epimerase [Roseicyclus sp. F158]
MRDSSSSSGLRFMKMHGLGNDFVVIDLRDGSAAPGEALVRALADRHFGVGFDQLVLIEAAKDADARMVFHNADGSLSSACGNATRCVARHLLNETGADTVTLETGRGLLRCVDAGGGLVRVNMGAPLLEWDAVPIAGQMDTLHLPIEGDPVATGMGNPHCTFFVDDAEAVDLALFGAAQEIHPLYPERTNVEVVQILSRTEIRVRVWERGAGITLASGSCSCAAAVAAARRGLTERRVLVRLDGGTLDIDWRDDGVHMTGPSAHVFSGTLTPAFLEAL